MKKIREILLFSLCVLLFSGSLTAAAADGAPIAENLEIMTYRGISVGGQLKAFDPEGEEVHFRITTEPRKGTLTLEENGEFVYTPAEGKRGRDYFGYCASDPNGNVSQEATVVITIRKAGKGAGYADTAGLSCEYAACVLAEEGLFTGRCVCGQYLFEPEETVSCGEFLSLCMETAGIEPVETTIDNPAQLGQWVETMRYSPVDSAYHTVYYRITNVVRGQEAQAAADAYNAEDHVMQFSALEDDNLEYCMLEYEVYFPEDFPQEDYGITTVDLDFSVESPDGGGIEANGVAYIGLSSVVDISVAPEINEFYAGQTFTEGKAIYAMVKGVSDYVFEVGYFDDNDQEHVSYVQGV